jgi:UDP-glucose 4-epimerase
LDLAIALKEIFSADNEIQIIGTRHSEKLYETLLTREEMLHAVDMGDYYRIPSDNRDLNYAKYFTSGEVQTSAEHDYHSHNTRQLNIEGTKTLLLQLDFIQNELKGYLND